MLVPMQVKAAEQDTVELRQEETKVAVALGMSNAKEEKISTIMVSLSINVEGQSQAAVTFDFDSGLERAAESDYIYNADTGRMDIYVSSLQNQSLFGDGELQLGYVCVEPLDASQTLQVEVGYLENSFQAANASYGSKTPVISSPPEPVLFQVGAGADDSASAPAPEGGNGGSGDGGQENGASEVQDGNAENGGQNAGSDDNMSQGLYDESTRFVNNPADAKNISSSVVRGGNLHPELLDLSKGTAVRTGGVSLTGSGEVSGSTGKISGRVSVVSPEEGPDSILIGSADSALSGADGRKSEGGTDGETAADGSGAAGGNSELSGTDEIRLDKKNGGIATEKNTEKTKWIIAGVAAAIIIAVGIGAFAIGVPAVKSGRKTDGGRKKKAAGRRKRKPAGKGKPAAKKKASPEKGRKRRR